MFGIEEVLSYKGHKHVPIKDFIFNYNMGHYITFDPKTLNMWSMETGDHYMSKKMYDLRENHCSISAVGYSHRYRLFCIVSGDFKMLFVNEWGYLVDEISM